MNARRRYERLLRWYPSSWRAKHGDVMLGTLLDADEIRGHTGPTLAEAWSLRLDGVRRRLGFIGGEPSRRRRAVVVIGASSLAVVALAAAALPTLASSNEMYIACMHSSGWPSQNDGDGVVTSVPAEQVEDFIAAGQACSSPAHSLVTLATRAGDLPARYTHLVKSQKCISQLGYETSEAPSEPVFLATLGTWSPFADLGSIPAAEFDAITRACPQTDDA